ncbi:MAG: glycosyltransferase [Deltaproteobacteria bacterium]
MKRLQVLVWHVHGNYLYYLGHVPHRFYVPVKEGRPTDYVGLSGGMPWPDNMTEVPADRVRELDIDCVIFQRPQQYFRESHLIMSKRQLARAARIYLEHDPPQEHPTDCRHFVNDTRTLLVHVTPFNELMWDSGRTPTMVIDHGVVPIKGASYTGEKDCGICVVNNLGKRGRRLGRDVYLRARRNVPLDLVGMGSEEIEGGLGEIGHDSLASFESSYRFFFNPIRYTSLGLAVCEAMMLGMPIVGLATTEMARVVENDISGYIDTDLSALMGRMRALIESPALARRLGEQAREYALRRFNIQRFASEWDQALRLVTGETVTTYSVVGQTRTETIKEYV